jgi:CMP-N-acetylneuraminic acid synthetase
MLKEKNRIKSAAVVPIKTNNQRLPGKNTMLLGNKPLLNYLFDTLINNEIFSEIFIDSSDEKILNIAIDYGFTPIKRPAKLNSPNTQGNELLEFEIDYIDYPIIAQLFVTLPFITNKTISSAIKKLISLKDIDSVFGVSSINNRFWFENKPINHNPYKLNGTQYENPIKFEVGFYVFKKSAFLKEKSRITKRHAMIDVPIIETIDIDEEMDFNYAEFLITSGRG